MKVKIGLVQTAQGPLNKLLNFELPIRVAFRMGRLLRSLEEVAKTAEEHRITLLKKYGKTTGEQIKVLDENIEVFSKELTELYSEEVEIDYEPVSIDDLGDVKLTAVEAAALETFVKFD